MASVSTGARVERPSYSKIAATGLKPPSTQQTPNAEHMRKHDITSSPRDGSNFVSPSHASNSSTFTPKQKKLVPLAPKDSKEVAAADANSPQVHVQNMDSSSPPNKPSRAPDGMLVPSTGDEAGTQVSSSSGSGKPPSVDSKSVASGTTFALDEKESLRPDDSASVKATDDEDGFLPPGSGLPGSRTNSDDGVRAFRDQLREISCMDSTRPGGQQHQGPGVLYVPPPGSGIGTVPGPAAHLSAGENRVLEIPPDPKLLEALDSPKDRIMVLKLEQDIVDFVKDAKESSLKLPQTNAFYRMLAHRLADYYMLGHIVDESTSAVRIYKTPNCRLPPPLTGIATPSTAASTPPPLAQKMKILRRGVDNAGPTIANGSNTPSKTTSDNGESGNDDEKKLRMPVSRQEREAKYEEARKRIMGESKPSDSPEESAEKDESRSSSAAGKKANRKKQRADSDDDFEARSAYSAYYPQPFVSDAATPPTYAYPNVVGAQNGQVSPAPYGTQYPSQGYQQYGPPSNGGWPNNSFNSHPASPNWTSTQHSGFDLSREFQRSMVLQPGQMQSSAIHPSFTPTYGHQHTSPQQQWQQPGGYISSYPASVGPNYTQGYPHGTQSPPNHFQESQPQPYQYGQLPSQTFPGRPPSKLEHPLPGSYKSKHFNPQSQSFVPGQGPGMNMRPFPSPVLPPANTAYCNSYGIPAPLHRQPSSSHQAQVGSPHQSAATVGPLRVPNQPMMHPLPQPVFPRQPSPNMPLPAKPEATPPQAMGRGARGSSNSSTAPTGQVQSSLAKWGTPASLPAKPPPPNEPFDPARFAHAQRQASSGNTWTGNGMPNFGSMPPMAGGYGPH